MIFLSDIPNNEFVQVEEINTSSTQLMAYGIFKGTQLRVIRNDRWQEMMLLEFEGKRLAIRKKDAKPIQVIRINGE